MDISQEQTVRLRPAGFDDAAGISKVLARNGMDALNVAEWKRRWEAYPCREAFGDSPIGWVLETSECEIVGTLDSVQVLYELDEKPVRAVVAAGWAVDGAFRRKSLQLMTTFFRQKNIDLWLNVTASPTTAQVLAGLNIPRIPIPDYGSPCFWPVRRHAFAKAALERREVRGASLLAWPAALALFARDIAVGSGRGKISSRIRRVRTFDDRFDALWQTIRKGPARLRAVRTCAVLEWRFAADLKSGRAVILIAENSAGPCGYAVMLRRHGAELGMELYDVADLQAVGDDPAVTRDLILGLIGAAREGGVDAVKLLTGTPAKRGPAMELRPYTYQLSFWQQYFKASAELQAALGTADAWDFSLFDSW